VESKGRRKRTKLESSGKVLDNRVCDPRALEGRGLNWGGGLRGFVYVLPCACELREFSNGGQDVGTARARTKGARQSPPNTGARALGDRPLERVGK
jgi:hypothetical protein